MPAANQTAPISLEFDRVLAKVADYASSSLGREGVLQIQPFHESELLQQRLLELSEFMALLQYDDPLPIDGIADIRQALVLTAHEGSTLSIEQLVAVAKTLEVAHALYRYLGGRQNKYPALNYYFKNLRSFVAITRAIRATIDAATLEVKDTASPELRQIRNSLRRGQERLRKRLSELVEKYQEFLQEPIITLREGRMVIPLREDCKGQVPGFIHDRSASGATLFIEPMAVFELNNQIREIQIEERREIERLLRELTDLIREQLVEIQNSFRTLCEIDVLYAIARFGVEWGAAVPKLHPHHLNIVHGYHPLLLLKNQQRDKVVPLDVTLGADFHLLIITGPNAGGKTVALKTIGLSALMFQCGLPVLVDEQSQFPLYDQIFVDIGDQQSVEQDLSTFSAHVARLAEIITQATPRSLVLIDEIGTGTDPVEGAALAMSFLRQLHQAKVPVVVTTHQGALKVFAHELAGAENASMSFDDATLQPTYHFRLGIPGSSYAFEIARRLGLPATLIQQARQLVGSAHDKAEKFILELEQKLNRYQQLLADTEIKKTELEGLTKLYRERYETLLKEEKQLKRKAVEESKAILARTNAVIEEAVREIRSQHAVKDSVKQARNQVAEVKQEIEEQLISFVADEPPSEQIPTKGDLAIWQGMAVSGRVISDSDATGHVWLEAGDLKLHLPLNDLRKAGDKQTRVKAAPLRNVVATPGDLRTEIDLRGMTMDEAQPVLEKYLDQAYLSGLEQVRIIHGKGTGALRSKVNDFLLGYPKIQETHFAAWNEGDIGVTVVHFKK